MTFRILVWKLDAGSAKNWMFVIIFALSISASEVMSCLINMGFVELYNGYLGDKNCLKEKTRRKSVKIEGCKGYSVRQRCLQAEHSCMR